MRDFIVAGNWKMNLKYNEASDLMLHINRFAVNNDQKAKILVGPPNLYLKKADELFHSNQIFVMAQDVSAFDQGAHTGEVSADMLKSVGTEYCIVGHSERREFNHETDEDIKMKVDQLIKNEIHPVFCCGETLNQRERGVTLKTIKSQITHSLFHLNEEQIEKVVIAYEPIWAIGTGKVATPAQAQEVHKGIRDFIASQYSDEVARKMSILYGGSVKPENAESIFEQPDVDGGLIGGASLDERTFTSIVNKLDKAKGV